jgi:hypothetical protein
MTKIYPNARHGGPVHPLRHNRAVSDQLHRRAYGALLGLALWFVVAIWAFFSGDEYTGLIFVVVTGLVSIMIAIPAALWATWSHDGNHIDDVSRRETFHDWAAGEFRTNAGQLRGAEALTQVLLPIAGVAIGMTIFGFAFYEVSSSVVTGG